MAEKAAVSYPRGSQEYADIIRRRDRVLVFDRPPAVDDMEVVRRESGFLLLMNDGVGAANPGISMKGKIAIRGLENKGNVEPPRFAQES